VVEELLTGAVEPAMPLSWPCDISAFVRVLRDEAKRSRASGWRRKCLRFPCCWLLPYVGQIREEIGNQHLCARAGLR
jgi:hypothetical protein